MNPDWESLLWETRGYLGLDDDAPVPVDELVEQAKANGYDERQTRRALREADDLESVGDDLDDLRLRLTEENSETADSSDTGTSGPRYSDNDPRGETGSNGAPDTPTPADGVAHVGETTYPAPITDKGWWVTWILDGHERKRPVAPWQTDHAYPVKWAEDLDAEDRPETSFEEARRWAEFDLGDAGLSLPDDARSDDLRLGIILPADRPALEERVSLIDWDDVRDPKTGEIHAVAAEYIDAYGGYVEVSRSGEGLHQYVLGGLRKRGKFIAPVDSEPFVGDDLPQVEIYDGGRHVAMTGEHVVGTDAEAVEAQEMIDAIISEYADAEQDAGHRTYDPEDGTDNAVRNDDGAADHVPDPETGEYDGPELETLRETQPDDRPLAYHAVVETFYRGGGNAGGYANVQNWRLEGFAAALGEREGLDPDKVKADLSGAYLDDTDVDCGCVHRTPERVNYGYKRARTGRLEAPSYTTLVEYGVLPPAVTADADDAEDETDPRDLLNLDVVVEPASALAAAAAVEPEDLADETPLPELEREDVDDVAIAAALHEGWIDTADEFPSDGRYTEAYYRARDRFGAPLPKYLDNTALEERTELVFAALDRVRPEHILDNLESDITVKNPAGEASARIDPVWEDSDSGERILSGYGAGFYCTEHSPHQPKGHHTFDALQVVALEHNLVEDEFRRPTGEAYKEAYRLLREEYGAPIPRWRATLLETVPVLPPAVRLLDDDVRVSDSSTETLQEARDRTEDLVRDAVSVRDRAQLLTNVPGTGKTYSAVATAADRPALYVTRRNDLKKQAEEYAAEIAADEEDHPDAEPSVAHLPILAENTLPEAAVREGVAAVREEGFVLLRDRHEELYERVKPHLEDEQGDSDDEDDDTADLDRGTCETAEGAYGDRWRVRVHIARALGLQPADLHRADEAVFGEPIPCQCDDHDEADTDAAAECELSVAWDRIRDPDRPIDLLVGSPNHAFVDSATTYYERDEDGDRVERERAVVIDEFPEESYFNQYAGRYMDHATWLAEALVDVDTREDLLAADLASDTWVNRWLDGEGEEYGVAADAIDALAAADDVADATDHAEALLDSGRLDAAAGETSANLRQVRAALETVADADPDADLGDAVDTFDNAVDRVGQDADAAYADGRNAAGNLYSLVEDLESVLDPLTRGLDAVDTGDTGLLETVRERVAALPVGGDLRALLEDAIDATRGDAPSGILEAATTALRGGRDGCRELALFAGGGYAHPDAWAHLAGAIADTDHDDVREVTSEAFTFDPEREGGRFKRFTRNGARILADKNHHGEVVVDPPAFTDATGATCPVVGLDATGRPELWKIAIGRDTQRRDIHATDAERRRFLRDTVDLTVVQTTNRPLPYHGSPEGKNFQEDRALVREVAAEYTKGADALDDKGPAVMSTQKVLAALEDDLAPHAGATVEYENMKGSDALGDHQVAVLLGSQHYSDAVPEKWGLVAGESPGRGDTKGVALDYGTEVANAYLQYMREDHVMQGILRAGRNDDTTVVFAHTSALRADLPVDAEGALVSAHSKGTLQVVEAAAELRGRPFTAREVADAIATEDGVGLRQVQNVLADLREAGYVDVREDGGRGSAYEYDRVEDPGLADVELPDLETETGSQNEKTRIGSYYTWNFVLDDAARGGDTPREASQPTIPASTAADAAATGTGPPG